MIGVERFYFHENLHVQWRLARGARAAARQRLAAKGKGNDMTPASKFVRMVLTSAQIQNESATVPVVMAKICSRDCSVDFEGTSAYAVTRQPVPMLAIVMAVRIMSASSPASIFVWRGAAARRRSSDGRSASSAALFR